MRSQRVIEAACERCLAILRKHGPMLASELTERFNEEEWGGLAAGWFAWGLEVRQVSFCLQLLRARGLVTSEGQYPTLWGAMA